MKFSKFDLQLFAETEPTPEPQPTPEATPEPAPEPQPTPETKPTDGKNTILGGETAEPENYDLTSVLPEGYELDQEKFNEFSTIAKECGLNNEQATKLAQFGLAFANDSTQAMMKSMDLQVENWGKQAKEELGTDFQNTVALAGAGLEALGKSIPNIRQALEETGAGNRVEIIRAMAMLGELTKEDTFRGFGASPTSPESIYNNTDFSKY
jgi:hypothetical protein